jgi:dTMP kinase
MSNIHKKGTFIVFEGLDRSGKSTQIKLLMENLEKNNNKAVLYKFPDRVTHTGELIHQYLQNEIELEPHVIHLLYSANRWEKKDMIIENINNGMTVICDRYIYSGIAYSVANGLDINWCKLSDIGLPIPDIVIWLDLDIEISMERSNFGNEIYERKEFQEKVLNAYKLLHDENWVILDANNSFKYISDKIFNLVTEIIKK